MIAPPALPSKARILELAAALQSIDDDQYDSQDHAIAEMLRAYFTLKLIARKHIDLTACAIDELEALQTLGVFDE